MMLGEQQAIEIYKVKLDLLVQSKETSAKMISIPQCKIVRG